VTAPKETWEDEDEDEDEVSDEEEDKFDIDDSSPEAAASKLNANPIADPQTTTIDSADDTPTGAAATLGKGRSKSKSRSQSRSSGLRSGVDTPGRYAGPQPHPPRIVQQLMDSASLNDLMSNTAPQPETRPSRMAFSHGRSRVPLDLEVMKTPTIADIARGRRHARANSGEYHPHRAFAVWGQDESDSNPSDSDH
jgi:NAD+ kinase